MRRGRGFIDLGRCGVVDRYGDLAQAIRSVRRKLGERRVRPFFAAYGIGELDEAKLRYYQLLDERFSPAVWHNHEQRQRC